MNAFPHRAEDDVSYVDTTDTTKSVPRPFRKGRETYRAACAAIRQTVPDSTIDQFGLDELVRIRFLQGFPSNVDIARAMSTVVRRNMDSFRQNLDGFTRSLGQMTGHGAVQMVQAGMRARGGKTDGIYVYLSGWMVAAARNTIGPMPDQSIQPNDSVPALVKEIYEHLRGADSVELSDLFDRLKAARQDGGDVAAAISAIDRFESHIVPIIVDIDAGYGDAMATHVLAKACIRAGASCIQIENQDPVAKQCGHQAGKVIVPPEEFQAKLRAVRLAGIALSVPDVVVVARTDSWDGHLAQALPHHTTGHSWLRHLVTEAVTEAAPLEQGELAIMQEGGLRRPKRLPNGMFELDPETGEQRVVEDCVGALERGGADLLWIETSTPDLAAFSRVMGQIREKVPDALAVYNHSPSFEWTGYFRRQAVDNAIDRGSAKPGDFDDVDLRSSDLDTTPIGIAADAAMQAYQAELAKIGVFHHLVTLPTYHMTAVAMDDVRDFFADRGMLAYVERIQRQEIRRGLPIVNHQRNAGTLTFDRIRQIASGDRALQAGGAGNTMEQFQDDAATPMTGSDADAA